MEDEDFKKKEEEVKVEWEVWEKRREMRRWREVEKAEARIFGEIVKKWRKELPKQNKNCTKDTNDRKERQKMTDADSDFQQIWLLFLMCDGWYF